MSDYYELPQMYELLTWQQRRDVRRQYIKKQNGKCLFCGCDLSGPASEKVRGKRINWKLFPKNFRKYPIHLHHDHKTGLTKGAVHNLCNAVMWQYLGE